MRRVTLIIGLFVGMTSAGTEPRAQGEEPPNSVQEAGETDAEVRSWISDLDSDRFVVRESATNKLVAAGRPAAPLVADALTDGSLELVTRGVHILQRLALSGDPASEEAARAALQQLAAARVTSAARQAAATLETLDELRELAAVQELKRLGANVQEQTDPFGIQNAAQHVAVQIDHRWKGSDADLDNLQWLRDVQRVVLSGPQVTDVWLEKAKVLPNVEWLRIAHGSVSNAGLVHLKGLKNLRFLDVWYSPIGDAAIDDLQQLRNAERVRLYGTDVTDQGAERLARALKDSQVDCRRGAFLGISCVPDPLHCIVQRVEPNSAAADAGLNVGDVITAYDKQKVSNFETLTALIGKNRPQEEVELTILRADEELGKTVRLGGWDYERIY
jgi:hypothetical protein